MRNTHAGPISRAKLEVNRRSKMPTREEMEQSMAEFPDNPTRAAIRAHELAFQRRWPSEPHGHYVPNPDAPENQYPPRPQFVSAGAKRER